MGLASWASTLDMGAGVAPSPAVPSVPTVSTEEAIANALAGLGGPVVQRFIYEWRDENYALNAPLFNVHPGGAVEVDVTRTIVWTSRFTIDLDLLPDGFSLTTSLVAISMEVLVQGEFVRFPLGLYNLDIPDERFQEGHNDVEVQASDMGIRLNGVTPGVYIIVLGANPIEEARTILTAQGLAHNLPDTPLVLPVGVSYGPGTTWRHIIDQLMKAINHYPVAPDGRGVLISSEQIDPAEELVDVVYDTDEEPRMIIPDFTHRIDRSQFKNVAVVVIDHPARTPSFHVRENNDGVSPVSTTNATSEFLQEIPGGLVIDTTVAGELAEFFVREQASRAEVAILRTFPDPRRSLRETYEVNVGGVAPHHDPNTTRAKWRQLGWRLVLDVGEPTVHRIGRARQISVVTP